jgi:hypothetical protein
MKKVLVLLLMLLAAPAWATTYYLDKTNPAASNSNAGTNQALPWLTLAKACSTLVAGDTVVLLAGSYDEACTPTNSGTAGNVITYLGTVTGGTSWSDGGTYLATVKRFNLSSRNYTVIQKIKFSMDGFSSDTSRTINVASGACHNEILDNYFYNTTANEGVIGSGGTTAACFIGVRRNKIENNGAPGDRQEGINLYADDSIIEGNDMSGLSDFTRPLGWRNVVRNNVFHDSPESDTMGAHVDGIQGFCNGTTANHGNSYSLYEGNQYKDNPGFNAHFYLSNTNTLCGTVEVIVRENAVSDAAVVAQVDTNSQGASSNQYVYNNSGLRIGNATASYVSGTTGALASQHLNNVFQDLDINNNWAVLKLKVADATSGDDYNQVYNTTTPPVWGTPFSAEPHKLSNVNPLFVNTTLGAVDLHLQAGSPSLQSGGSLTTVATADTGSGTTLVLDDAGFFQPGWAGVLADEIAIGTRTNTAQIASINYATNTVTLVSGISRNDGDEVWLFRNSSGTQVLFGSAGPDRGAYQTNPTPSGPPTPGNSGVITTASPTTTSLTLNWTKATDSTDPQSSLEYEVCQSTANNITSVAQCEAATIIRSFIADINTFGVTGLSPITRYYWNVVVKDTDGNKAAYVPVTAVTPCGATKLVFTSQPQDAALGASLGTVVVEVQNASSTRCTDSSAAVTLSKDGGATWGTLTSATTLTKTASSGDATWTADLSVIDTAGAGSIVASSSGLTSATSNSITISAVPPPPVPGIGGFPGRGRKKGR